MVQDVQVIPDEVVTILIISVVWCMISFIVLIAFAWRLQQIEEMLSTPRLKHFMAFLKSVEPTPVEDIHDSIAESEVAVAEVFPVPVPGICSDCQDSCRKGCQCWCHGAVDGE